MVDTSTSILRQKVELRFNQKKYKEILEICKQGIHATKFKTKRLALKVSYEGNMNRKHSNFYSA